MSRWPPWPSRWSVGGIKKIHKVSLAHNVSFWAQKLTHNVSFWAQKLCWPIITISGPINWRYGSVYGPRNGNIFSIFWAKKLSQEFLPLKKEKINLNIVCISNVFNRNNKNSFEQKLADLKVSSMQKLTFQKLTENVSFWAQKLLLWARDTISGVVFFKIIWTHSFDQLSLCLKFEQVFLIWVRSPELKF